MRLALVLLLVAIDASAIGTHCASIETVAFSCSVSSSNVLSVCLLKGPIENPPAVSYRFGRLGAPDLVFPTSSIGSAQKFRSAHYFRHQVDRTELSLSNAGTEYTVFDYFDGEQKQAPRAESTSA